MAKTDKFSFLNYEYLTKDIKKLPNARLSDLEKKYTFSYLGGHYGIKNTSPDFDQTHVKPKKKNKILICFFTKILFSLLRIFKFLNKTFFFSRFI